MEKKLDLRGLSCPIPLQEAKKALAQAATVLLAVDDHAARESIIRFANSQKYRVECITNNGSDFSLVIHK
ncbi:sulfurtransferase TusA family protein [Anaerospora hongkongensis]|uniref:sulfurtransferase TusA family protein n=1 Tax=Anaerospora hongkongensis TaxID=244830 RepID=UPI00289A6C8F|nr:sulfurtransferase TusA family protein [Anaerospora hongkongensis]